MRNPKIDLFEIYRFEVTSRGFNLTIKEVFYNFILGHISSQDALATLSEILKTVTNGFVIFHISLPFMNSNEVSELANMPSSVKSIKQISFLLMMLDLFSSREGCLTDFFLSDEPQLLTIATTYNAGEIHGGCHLGVCFSKTARDLLQERYPENKVIPLCEEAIFNFYFGLNINKDDFEIKRQAFLTRGRSGWEFISTVVEEGVPRFTVPTGNCACLSSNASRFSSDGKMHDHNVDRPAQHLALLAGVVTLWNEVLRPLHQNKC